VSNYKSTTPGRVKLIDCFLAFLIVSGIAQFAYRLLITSHPYNAFAGG
jgi:oligosaccharyltransferase complex subunit epsilon